MIASLRAGLARAACATGLTCALTCGPTCGSAAVVAQDAVPVPALTARVTDTAALMTAEQRAALESVLTDYENRKGTQIAVLTVPSTAPEAIEQYGIRVAEAWRIGRGGVGDGVILIVARDNPRELRRLRIEVGRGLEGAVTDQRSRRIIDEDIAPHFRQNDYYGGLVAGVGRIESLLEGEALPAATPKAGAAATGGIGIGTLVFLFIVASLFFRSGRRGIGYVSGDRGLNRSIGPMVLGGILGSLGGRGGGGFGGGGGGGGGGFSGGGGDFGGGGASGDW